MANLMSPAILAEKCDVNAARKVHRAKMRWYLSCVISGQKVLGTPLKSQTDVKEWLKFGSTIFFKHPTRYSYLTAIRNKQEYYLNQQPVTILGGTAMIRF